MDAINQLTNKYTVTIVLFMIAVLALKFSEINNLSITASSFSSSHLLFLIISLYAAADLIRFAFNKIKTNTNNFGLKTSLPIIEVLEMYKDDRDLSESTFTISNGDFEVEGDYVVLRIKKDKIVNLS